MTRTERPLELSDIVSGKHAAILADPYGFLGLPPDSPLDVVRGVYIDRAKRIHPDMIQPTLPSVDALNKRLMESGSLKDLLHQPSALGPDATDEEKAREERERFAAAAGVTVEELDHQENALRAMQELAHTRMVELNTAYEAITKPLSKRQRESLVGYRIVELIDEPYTDGLFNEPSRGRYQQIDLEGQARVRIFPESFFKTDPYSTPGAYLDFDWAPPRDHRWMTSEIGYAEQIFVKHLFVHYELQEGREQISPVLLEPFYETFGLDSAQRETFMRMLVGGEAAVDILQALGVREPIDISRANGGSSSQEFWRSRNFLRDVNEMIHLNYYVPSWSQTEIPQIRAEDGKIKLKAYTETVLSESDTILLQTIAYGPTLRGEI